MTEIANGGVVGMSLKHSGAVNTSTSPKVQYTFADGSANTIRPTGVVYPNGNTLAYAYGTSGSLNDLLSRIQSLVSNGTDVTDYTYLGLSTPVTVTYPEASVQYNLAIAASSTNLYAGLDTFGRVIDCRWQNIVGTPFDVARLKYGYDQASNRLWRQDVVAQSYSQNFDELYTNDGLYRLQTMQRGQLNGTQTAINSGTLNFKQDWTLDPTGNWHGFIEEAGGTSVTLNQTRTANTVNEITGITNSVSSAWAQPHYDAAGNMTTIPQPNAPGNQYTGTFDAWQRMTQLLDPSTGDIVQQNQYDGRNFRIAKLTYTGGTLSETRQFYHTASWQVLEERISGTTPDRQYIWGLRYIDDLVLRDRSVSGTLDERLYALQDANWNMVALLNPGTSAIVERFAYSPYGVVLPLNPGFTAPYTGTDFDWTVLYTGRELDLPTGLYYYRNRYYHANLGGFVGPDAFEGGLRSYLYCWNRPLNYVDKYGLEPGLTIVIQGADQGAQIPVYPHAMPAGIAAMNSIAIKLGECKPTCPPYFGYNSSRLDIYLYILGPVSPITDKPSLTNGEFGHELQHINAMLNHINQPTALVNIFELVTRTKNDGFRTEEECNKVRTQVEIEIFKRLAWGFVHNSPHGNPLGPTFTGKPAAAYAPQRASGALPLTDEWLQPMEPMLNGSLAYPDALLGIRGGAQNRNQNTGWIKPLAKPPTDPYNPFPPVELPRREESSFKCLCPPLEKLPK